MTYRQWMKKAKESRAVTVPDIRERLPLSADEDNVAPYRTLVIRRVVAGVAAAAMLVLAVGYIGWSKLFGDGDNGIPSASVPNDTPIIPLHTVMQSVTMLHGSTPAPIIDNMGLYVGARLLYVSYNMPPEHSECQGVFYDMEQQRYFCADHIMKPALERERIPTAGLYMHYYHPIYEKIVFTCKDSARSSYVYDVTNDTFHRLPVSLYYCPSVLGSLQTTHPYVLLHQMGGSRDDLYLVNLLTAELTYILKDNKGNYIYSPMDDTQITDDGKYVYYTLAKGGGEVVNSPARTTVLYEIATGKSRTFIGEVIDYLSDTQRFLLNTPDGYVVYDIATDKKTPFTKSDLPSYYAYYIKHTDVYTEFDYRLLLCNRITGEEKQVTDEYVVASEIIGQYLYYYIRGEESLHVRDLISGGEEYLPLDKALVQETESEENKNRSLHFGLRAEEERGEIWVYYSVTDTPRQDAEEIRLEREKVPYYAWQEFVLSEDFTSITALEPLLRRYPEYSVTAYEGDGFIFLDYTALTDDGNGGAVSNRLIALEDYDGGMFYTVTHQDESYNSSFSHSKGVTLTAQDERNTRVMLEELNIPVEPAYRDYRPYFSSDPQVKIPLLLSEINSEKVNTYGFKYAIWEMNGYEGARLYFEDEESKQAFRSFIAFTDTLNYYKLVGESQEYTLNHSYYLSCHIAYNNSCEIYIGRSNGKPFLVKNGCVADLTEDQYTKWAAWMDKQELKGHVD